MQGSLFVLIFQVASGFLFNLKEDTCFRSDPLKELSLTQQAGTYFIRDDESEQEKVSLLEDRGGIIYWHRRIKTPVCLTGECKLIDIGLYWHCTGDFLGLEVYGEHLTKTDHSVFTSKDYDKLLSVLNNDWSVLREYERSELLNEEYEEIDEDRFPDTKIIPPVYIGDDVELENCTVGPKASIAEGSKLNKCTVKNSLIQEHAQLEDCKIEDSTIGRHVELKNVDQEVHLGDHTKIGIEV